MLLSNSAFKFNLRRYSMGADQHGQDATKAAVRACRNAIEFNSIPSIKALVPGGYDAMKLHIQIGAPAGAELDLDKVRAVFPYGNIVDPIDVCVGGLVAKSGIAIPEMVGRCRFLAQFSRVSQMAVANS
jgi:uncharacterized protein (TIGR02058 family)